MSEVRCLRSVIRDPPTPTSLRAQVRRADRLRRDKSVIGDQLEAEVHIASAVQREPSHAQSAFFYDYNRAAFERLFRLLKRYLESFDHMRCPRIVQTKQCDTHILLTR